MPENTEKIQESSKFKRGQSGNPNGKPKGARNKSTLAAEKLLEGSNCGCVKNRGEKWD